MRTWSHGSMLTWLRMFGVIVRGVVSRIVIVLMEEATKKCFRRNTITVPEIRGVQEKCA